MFIPSPAQLSGPAPHPISFGILELTAFIRRRWRWMAAGVFLMMLAGGAYLSVAQEKYSATATLLIDTRKTQVFGEGDVYAEAVVSNSTVETEVQLLRSRRTVEAVVDKLHLEQDPHFAPSEPGFLSTLSKSILENLPAWAQRQPQAAEVSPSSRRQALIEGLMANLDVERIGLSYVIGVTFVSDDASEAARIANAMTDAYLSERVAQQVSKARELSTWLQARLNQLSKQALLPDLSAEEKSAIRATYDAFSGRYVQAVQQESLPIVQADVVAMAVPPMDPDWPKKAIVLAAALVLGLALGTGIAVLRDLFDRGIRTRQQLELASQTHCLGHLPIVRFGRSRIARGKRAALLPDAANRTFAETPEFSARMTGPYEQYCGTLWNLRVAAAGASTESSLILGITSPYREEGKTTVAVNLARLVGERSPKVLLVDADLRTSALTRRLVPPGSAGLMHILEGRAQLTETLWSDPSSQIHFLPSGVDQSDLGSEMLSSARMKEVAREIRQRFSFVVVDLPPVLPFADVREAADLFDALALVVEWGGTTEESIRYALSDGKIQRKLMGTVLNKVRMSQLRRFEQPA